MCVSTHVSFFYFSFIITAMKIIVTIACQSEYLVCVPCSTESESVVVDGQTSPDVHDDGTVHVPQRTHFDIRTAANTTASPDE